MEAISVSGVTVCYGRKAVLAGASLVACEGDRVVIFGPTGCGKTTLLHVVAGLLKPQAGSISLFGRQVSGNGVFLPPEQRSLGVVFQRALLWPHMTAAQNVEFALWRLGLPRARRRRQALEAMALFGAEDLARRRPETLSGGQIQRVALARSVAARPKILLWDEPFSGLDCDAREAVAASSLEFMDANRATLLAVSHDADEARALCARCYRIADGKVVSLD